MEVRKLVIGAELRAAGDFAIVGKALSYNVLSPTGTIFGPGTAERIEPGAFAESVKNDDIRCLVNHESSRILGRTKSGTLTLQDGPDALRFRVQLDKNSQAHRDTYAAVQRLDLSECSFQFSVDDDAWVPGTDSDGRSIKIRSVKKGKLLDVSVVAFPAYSEGNATSAETRAAAAVNTTHGVIEAVKILRQAAQSIAKIIFRADSSPTDFASRLTRCHEQAELACIMSQRCYDEIGDDEEGDPDDEVLRGSCRMAQAGLKLACEHFATARLRHGVNMDKKKQAKLLGRGR